MCGYTSISRKMILLICEKVEIQIYPENSKITVENCEMH